ASEVIGGSLCVAVGALIGLDQPFDVVPPLERVAVGQKIAQLGDRRNPPLQVEEQPAKKRRVVDPRRRYLYLLRCKENVARLAERTWPDESAAEPDRSASRGIPRDEHPNTHRPHEGDGSGV
ncbi:MAG TPA: hypothetical protein VMV69_29645, partial [Pirellulales bacterium]|nr:hypothetical protein [Pirellulales bacterium]